MRVLYVTQNTPWNPKFGGAMRSHGIVRGLDRACELHIALAPNSRSDADAFVNDNPSYQRLSVLVPDDGRDTESGMREIASLARGRAAFGKSFGELVETVDPDIVWYSGKESVRRVGFARSRPQVLDMVDVQWRKLQRTAQSLRGSGRAKALAKTAGCLLEDRWIASKADVVVVANSGETGLLGRTGRTMALPNGFDFGDEPVYQERTSKTIVFFGSMFYYPNLDAIDWFCREIWPKVKSCIPDARLEIVGHHEGHLDSLPVDSSVSIRGFVDDLTTLLTQSAFLIVPLRIAAGTRLKILEAWSCGLPVVTTTIGAEGLNPSHESNALIGDTPDRFADECVRLLSSPELGLELAREGFAHGKRSFDWEAIYPILDEVLNIAITSRRR